MVRLLTYALLIKYASSTASDYGYLQEKILVPALAVSRERGLIAADEHTVLLAVMKLKTAKSADLSASMPALGDEGFIPAALN
ncbi:hypothetical protein [Pseudoduganella aquatica]|uniref:Uncharacterized protein n=1 Tax=Pseudoduganella aquatica TaxID=2660641 RepID=A0A7X4HG66_9BURK|nr:hypothetical protein [Pseudoduganella aquatica]MYN09575.1 hypothetical protein [Pseudoduganella aquatica]